MRRLAKEPKVAAAELLDLMLDALYAQMPRRDTTVRHGAIACSR